MKETRLNTVISKIKKLNKIESKTMYQSILLREYKEELELLQLNNIVIEEYEETIDNIKKVG